MSGSSTMHAVAQMLRHLRRNSWVCFITVKRSMRVDGKVINFFPWAAARWQAIVTGRSIASYVCEYCDAIYTRQHDLNEHVQEMSIDEEARRYHKRIQTRHRSGVTVDIKTAPAVTMTTGQSKSTSTSTTRPRPPSPDPETETERQARIAIERKARSRERTHGVLLEHKVKRRRVDNTIYWAKVRLKL
jgi:hypothetical protein